MYIVTHTYTIIILVCYYTVLINVLTITLIHVYSVPTISSPLIDRASVGLLGCRIMASSIRLAIPVCLIMTRNIALVVLIMYMVSEI